MQPSIAFKSHKHQTTSFLEFLIPSIIANLVSGEVDMDDIKEYVQNMNVDPTEVHTFVDSAPGPFAVLDLGQW